MKLLPTLVNLPAGATGLSEAIQLNGRLVGIQMPATWAAANITFQASANGDTFYDVYDSAGTEVSVTAVQARYIVLDPTARGFFHLKVRSGTAATPVNQTTARTLVLLVAVE